MPIPLSAGVTALLAGWAVRRLGALVVVFVGAMLPFAGLMLLVVGARILLPDSNSHTEKCASRRSSTPLVLGATFAVGLLTGLLANGGGFLLVPLFVIVLGFTATKAAGTSMVAVGALTVPTLVTHWALGHIDWKLAGLFAVGVLPGSQLGASLSQHIPAAAARRAFGALLVAFSIWFLLRQG